ncbi:hypothetical protein KGQ20_03870 [Catenulispora sp. NF23]|uniref:Uncharacterized protein n=1 Tax=Catenulispora pinistramenti TaxID=2705254 RepID=A0ABS5KMU2_9ACTN|nr:hypothetical protein [Catenulispora pinistramenti]MBS2531904.1 hypothetical protein [Catenulispora pinistramenti]MBS2547383.1 hypothetical protein [Catenulispora pinistramenti]
MKSRIFKLTATASATALLVGAGAVAATSASATTAPAAVVTHTATVPMSAPITAHYPHWWPWCEIDLLGPVLCVNL